MWTQLTKFAFEVADDASNVLIAFAAIGTLTMAIIQSVKDLTPVTRWFHKCTVGYWLGFAQIPQLAELATAGSQKALFGLELERVCGLINASSGIVLDYPAEHSALLMKLARGASDKDLSLLINGNIDGRAGLDRLRLNDPTKFDEVLDARTRVGHRIQRNIDAFMIKTGFWWKQGIQWLSFGLSVYIALYGIAAVGGTDRRVAWVIGIAAGFFAPIAHDLISVLSKIKKPA